MAKKILYADKRIIADDTPTIEEYAPGDVVFTTSGQILLRGTNAFTTLGDLTQIGSSGSVTPNIVFTTSSTTVASNTIVLIDLKLVTSNVVITLPANPSVGDFVTLKNIYNNPNYHMFVEKGTSAQTIDERASVGMNGDLRYSSFTVVYIGNDSWIVDRFVNPDLGLIY